MGMPLGGECTGPAGYRLPWEAAWAVRCSRRLTACRLTAQRWPQVADLQLHQLPHNASDMGHGGGAARGDSSCSSDSGGVGRGGLHLSMAALLASVWWFYQSEQPAVQRKMLFAVLFPARAR